MKIQRVLIVILAVAALVGLGASVEAAGGAAQKRAENPTAYASNERGTPVKRLPSPRFAGGSRAPQDLGTIQYDNGTVTAFPGNSSFCFGNHFNTANANPLTANGSVTQLSWYMASGAGTDNVFISFFDQLAGTAANPISSASVPATNPGGFNSAAVGVPYVGSTFLAGVWYVAGDTVGLGSGTTGGQGIHGMSINDIVATGFAPLSVNALVRATGNLVIPVELTSFEILDD